jgi:DNA-binding transcriptional MerR regulator
MTATSVLGKAVDSVRNVNDNAGGPIAGREMTIGEMARAYGMTLRTLRFYEDRRLLKPRRLGNARYYSGLERERLEMIVKGKQLGFTLTEIADLIGLEDGAASEGAAKESVAKPQFEARLRPAQIVDQIDHLERQRREIDDAIALLRATRERMSPSADAV